MEDLLAIENVVMQLDNIHRKLKLHSYGQAAYCYIIHLEYLRHKSWRPQ